MESLLRDRGLLTHDVFDEIVTRSTLLDLESPVAYPEIVAQAAGILAEELGSPPELLRDKFLQRTRGGGTVTVNGIAIPHLRLPTIKIPMMALVRCQHGLEIQAADPEWGGEAPSEPLSGLLFLVSPEGDAAQHLHVLARFAEHAGHSDFLQQWRGAENELTLKETLLRDEGSLSLVASPGAGGESLIGTSVADLDVPEDCLVAMLSRREETFVPLQDSVIQQGDRLTFIGGPQGIRELRENYSLPSSNPS
jgi:mannitol/fructose-specific phosphotransferase system IIA component (Ntr-type)